MARTMMDFIAATMAAESRREQGDTITYKEWCHIRNNGTPEEIAEAVERMEAAGGYDTLE